MKYFFFFVICILLLPFNSYAQHTVLLDTFNDGYSSPSPILQPTTAVPGGWNWVYFGFGPPAYGTQEAGLVLPPNDGSNSSWRYNMPNAIQSGQAILLVWFSGSFGGETWVSLDEYLASLGEPPIDWNFPVTFEVDVWGHNTNENNTWTQGFFISQYSGAVTLNNYNHPVTATGNGWFTPSVILNGAPTGGSLLLGLLVDFDIGAENGDVNAAIFENLRITYEPINTITTPTMTQWGMIIFAVLSGLGAVYFMRKKARTNI
jgi:hypothetical protein